MGNTNSNSTKSRSNGTNNQLQHANPVAFQSTISNTATITATQHMSQMVSTAGSGINIFKTQNERYSIAETHTRSSTIKENEIYGHTMNDTVVVNQYTEDITAVSSPLKMTMITEDFNSDNERSIINRETSPLSKPVSDIYSNGQYEEAIDHANTIDLSGLDSCSPSNSPPAPSQVPSSRQAYGSGQLVPMQTMLDLSGNASVGRSRKVETPLDIGEKVWILSNNTHLWRECVIREHKEKMCRSSKLESAVDIKKLTIRVHYISFSSYYDEWLDHDSPRIALQRPDGDKLHINDNFSLYSEKYKAWLEAEVMAIDHDNHTVQVMLVSPYTLNGNPMEREWFSIHSPLISISHKRWDDAAPIVWNKSVKL